MQFIVSTILHILLVMSYPLLHETFLGEPYIVGRRKLESMTKAFELDWQESREVC